MWQVIVEGYLPLLYYIILCMIRSFVNMSAIVKRENRKNVRKFIENKNVMWYAREDGKKQ